MDSAPGVVAAEDDLCAPFLAKLPVTGAAVSLFGGAAAETLFSATDELAAHLDALQFELGEGPRWRARKTRLPVLIPDTKSASGQEWPMFHRAIQETDAAALFVFPLTVGAVDLGVVELYRHASGNLSPPEQATAAVLAGQASWYLLRRILNSGSPDGSGALNADPPVEPGLASRREIHQATGMVLAQSGATAKESLLLLRAYAFANELTMQETAEAVLQRRLSFAPGNGGMGASGLQ